MSFSDILKQKSISAVDTNSGIAVASTMTLAETDNMIPAYSGEETFQKSDKYLWYDKYYDDKYSIVDELKNIKLGEGQVNLTQEKNSQVIPFLMNRYYDGMDLTDMLISVYFVNKENKDGENPVINFEYSDTKIRFYWLLDDLPTAISGKLKIEIIARGYNEKGAEYLWRTRTNEEINILESLAGNGAIEPGQGWNSYIELINNSVLQAQSAAEKAKNAATEAQQISADVDTKIENASSTIKEQVLEEISTTLLNYCTKEEVEDLLANIDISSQLEGLTTRVETLETEFENFDGLANLSFTYDKETKTLTAYNGVEVIDSLVLNSDPSAEWVATYNTVVDNKISDVVTPVQDELTAYKEQIDADLQSIHENIDNLPSTLESDYYNRDTIDEMFENVEVDLTGYATESYVDTKINALRADVDNNTTNIQGINSAITTINQTLESIDKSPNAQYMTTYNEPYTLEGTEYTGENALVLYEIFNKDKENEIRSVVSAHVITGGSGGSASANTIKIERVTPSPFVVTASDKVEVTYNFIGTDASGDDIGQGNVTWKLGSKVIKTETVYTGTNTADLTEYINIGSDQKLTLIITDDIGTMQQKTWYVSVVDVKLESTFDDTRNYTANEPVTFTFTPYGAVDKTLHFLLDGKEIDTKPSLKASAGLSDSYVVPAQTHGTHLFEVYITATINNNYVESNHIVKDIIWYDETSKTPVIGCVKQKFTARQYEATNITYTVYNPSTETPSVTLKASYVNEDGETVETYNSNLVLDANTNVWSYKTDAIGEHTLTITCGETVKTLNATITEIGIDVSPTTAGLEFDFNPVGYSNNDTNRIWSDSNTGVGMTVSDNFDWVNGGYQLDDAGDQYFCIKAGTTATIHYNLFADDAKVNGKSFKAIFKTTNIKNRNTSFISCMDNGIGLDMKVESANIYSSNSSLYSPYCEEDIIEFDFNIFKNTEMPIFMTFEDGLGFRPMSYTSDSSFWQTSETPITIGSPYCDVHIYRMKAYSTSLSDKDILNNWIADARSAEEMVRRYNKNQIYKNGLLDPEYFAEKYPEMRVIMIDAPWFTNDKDNKVDGTNITHIYKGGDALLDNWTCTGAEHSGQGTSSNEYGDAARNIDLIMNTETSVFTLGDGITTANTITLTRSSIPVNYLNLKVNVASSEGENNAQHAHRYNQFNPFVRYAKAQNSNVKDCMEFYNCVVFIRERDEDISTHREFNDTNWHFYSVGNIGDSKKTDSSRVNDKNDPKECIVEITDYNVPLAEFPTGKDGICPIDEWKAGNTAYDNLYAEYKYKDGKFKSFGSESYEFRYETKGITDEQRQSNIDAWRDFYKFVVTSSDEEFYARLKEYFVVDSALYFYLYTERYTMVDNRAKNSFWHYGKVYITTEEYTTLGEDLAKGYIVDDEQASIRDGYRWDLSFGYDFDTSLGIDNTGKLVLTYGKEDTDYYVAGDSTSGYIYRAAESKFFCRVRDLFKSEMQAMFVDRENQNAWSSSGLIKQWDDAQEQFPEEILRLHYERLYFRTYLGISIDNSIVKANTRFLLEMMNGRKKYQRRMFERNQELYMASKYFGKVATQDQIMMRFNNPVGATITPNFTLYITPYSDMYIGTSFGNVTPTNFRAKAGVEYTIPCSIESGTADITLIYAASFIQAIGDLSRCYVGDNDFSKGTRLQRLVIGSDIDGYSNSFMTKINIGNNKLLEYLDIQNVTGLNSVVDLSQCNNLLELYAQGSGATGVVFANGGKLQKAYIPSVISLTMKNLNNIEEFVIDSYNNLQTLIVEYTPFMDTHEIVTISPILKVLRLAGIDWQIENTDILDKLMLLRGINNTGGEVSTSVLIGDVHVPVIRQQKLYDYQSAWSDLEITFDTMIEQYPVTFKNYDGSILEVQYVDKGEDAVDPITRTENPMGIPTKPSTVSHDFTFNGWDSVLTGIFSARTVTATYVESLRSYTVKYVSKGITLQESSGLYGSIIYYEGSDPVYTAEETAYVYHMFSRWDKSGYVDGDKTINAIFDRCVYTEGYFDGKELSDLTPVEIYAMTQLGLETSVIQDMDKVSFTVGKDYDYDDIETHVLIDKKTSFNGTNHIDTGIQLFAEDRDFVLAIDYEFLTGTTTNSVIAQCFQSNGNNGFKLWYSGSSKVSWGTTTSDVGSIEYREMLVIRHKKGENNLWIYNSDLANSSPISVELTRTRTTNAESTLVFGAAKADDGLFENHAIGNIHWCKLWYTDLGEDICTELVGWTHEHITQRVGGFKKYYLSDNPSKRCSFTLLGDHLLERKRKLSNLQTNEGGWAEMQLNSFLNERLYNAFPSQWKALIKKVTVSSSVGSKSTDLSTSDCYITIPACIEVDPTMNTEPYIYEGSATSYMTTNDMRKRAYDGGDYDSYWLRSPNVQYANYMYQVNASGELYGYNYPNVLAGVVIEFSI